MALSTVFFDGRADVAAVGFILIFGFFLSLPAFVLCVPLFAFIRRVKLLSTHKLLLWICAIFASVLINDLFLDQVIFRGLEAFSLFLMFSLPGVVAAIIATLILYPQFQKAVKTPGKPELILENELSEDHHSNIHES